MNCQHICTHIGGYESVVTNIYKANVSQSSITVPYVVITDDGNILFKHLRQKDDCATINGIATL